MPVTEPVLCKRIPTPPWGDPKDRHVVGYDEYAQEAFDPARLGGQLDAAMREFVNDERHVQVDDAAGKVRLSKIFDWFRADFIDHEAREGNDDPTLIDYINRYRPAKGRIPASYKVEFNKYDKGINRQP